MRPWRPPFHASPAARKGPISSKSVSSQDPFWENLEILASTASIFFTQILAHKSPNLEIFSSQTPKFGNFQLTSPQIWKFSAHKPPCSEASVSSQAPHFGKIRAAHPYLKKSWVPPGGPTTVRRRSKIFQLGFKLSICVSYFRIDNIAYVGLIYLPSPFLTTSLKMQCLSGICQSERIYIN